MVHSPSYNICMHGPILTCCVPLYPHRACNSVFTALDHCQEAVEITSEDHIIQVGMLHTHTSIQIKMITLSVKPTGPSINTVGNTAET